MEKGTMEKGERISPSALLIPMGATPADNREGLKTALPWKSTMAGAQAKALFQYQQTLASVSENYSLFGPLAVLASLQNTFLTALVLDPMKAHARLSVRSGRDPDLYRDQNGWIYKNYSRLIYFLCDYFMQDILIGTRPAASPQRRKGMRYSKNIYTSLPRWKPLIIPWD
jgi:hypothetical protein